ncbi:MAG TPA: 6,7-dimethyl-8-ribityllumazine synthase [Nitrospiraceae bacterium]|nr:6,7-dimethyl-8-ribityllumazine synthase [Nitrospiraceae bacterium]
MRLRKGTHDATGLRFGIVVSKFNKFVTSRLLAAAVETLKKAGAADEALEVVHVPGAFEIPLAARALARTGRFDAVLCLGAVIRGDTPHFDYISAEASRGIGQVALEYDLPVIFGVLTTNTVAQAIERADPAKHNRGADAARTAIEMVTVLADVRAKPADSRPARSTTSKTPKKKTGTRS